MSKESLEQWQEQCAAAPGKKWRVLAHDGEGTIEHADEGTFDELVVDHWLHIEQMDTRNWWMRVGDVELSVTVDPDGSVTVDVARGVHAVVRGTTKMDTTPSAQ